jgi:hypothetical protein
MGLLVLTGCAHHLLKHEQTTSKGVITGVAAPCVGVAIRPGGYSKIAVTVYLTRGSRAVSQQTVAGSHVYRFVVPGGPYTVATHEGGGSKPVNVLVRAGRVTHADIPSYCM